MELVVAVVGARPTGPTAGVCAQYVVVDDQVVEAHRLHRPGVAGHVRRVRSDLGLGEDCPQFQVGIHLPLLMGSCLTGEQDNADDRGPLLPG